MGWNWVGDPTEDSQGAARRLDYNILPYMEFKDVHDMGKGAGTAAKLVALAQMSQTVVPTFIAVASRAALYPFTIR